MHLWRYSNLVGIGSLGGDVCIARMPDEQDALAVHHVHGDGHIMNSVLISPSLSRLSAAPVALCSSNSMNVTLYDTQTCRCICRIALPWAVNYTNVTQAGTLLCCVGDARDSVLVDVRAHNTAVAALSGHTDFSFACTFSPDDGLVITGSQDGCVADTDADAVNAVDAVADLLAGRSCAQHLARLRFASP